MRIVLSSLLAAGLLTSQMAAAQSCARPADKTAFDVAGLKSQMMVTAITFDVTERYNSFVLRYRPDLVAQEKVLAAYFARNFGKKAQAHHDGYITALANSQPQTGLKAGSAFCERNLPAFDGVMKLRGGTKLSDFATGQQPVQPIELVGCATPDRRTRTSIRTASVTVAIKTR